MIGGRLKKAVTKKAVRKTTKKKEVVKEDVGGVGVYDGDRFIRIYTSELHGKDYKKLAEQFANKNNYDVK